MGAAWEEMSSDTDMIIRSFKKCGISVPIDGSADSDINIAGLDDYTVESGEDTDGENSDMEDPFANTTDESDTAN